MLSKVQFNLPWNTKNYAPFLNEECEDSVDLSDSHDFGQYHTTLASKDKSEIEDEDIDNNVYSLPPSASSSLCLPPNPDPPPFDVLHEPLVIESRGGNASKSSPTQDKMVDPFYADSLKLQREILSPGGIEIYISAHDLLKNVAVIELENSLW
ncbi:unnamed protein product [Rodentolepis nana]|uniref:Ovule protein n=1 Tax=Rodentolepis nana TaxID=102285 RepID=A0A0R3T7W2_RODNA|nr:unnamed protein product [Rodentolepis nana]